MNKQSNHRSQCDGVFYIAHIKVEVSLCY